MKRLLLVPVVVCPVAAVGAALWVSGLAWPVATQAWSVLAPRPDTAETEADIFG